MPNLVKSAAKFVLQHAGGLALARRMHRDALRILMYHRFSDRAALARQCAHIRRHYHPVTMTAVSNWLRDGGQFPPYAVAVTVDDGYRDFLDAGYPVFAEYEIPVTVFLVTDFLDGKLWLWFDRVLYAFEQAQVADAKLETPDCQVLRYNLRVSPAERRATGQQLADAMVSWSAADRDNLVRDLPAILKAKVPAEPPLGSQPLTWGEVRTLARSGVEFGAHTKTHPILSAVESPVKLLDEITGSKARIEAQLDRPALHFCYPNGKMRDIGSVATQAVRAAGMRTAVTAEPGLTHRGDDAFLLRRIGADPSHEPAYFARSLSGLGLQ